MATKVICPGCATARIPSPYCRNCGVKLNVELDKNLRAEAALHDKAPEKFHQSMKKVISAHQLKGQGYNYCSLCGESLE